MILGLAPAQVVKADLIQVVPGSPVLLPGSSETVSINFTATENFLLQSVDLAIGFDNTRFTVSNVMLGTLDSNFLISAFQPATGQLTTSSAGTGNAITTGTSGSILTFTLTALANAPLGGALGDLNLERSFLATTTAINEGQIALTPPPTNGFDAGVDGTVIVGPASVPEPASMILVCTGVGGAFLANRLRRKRASATVMIS